MHVDPALRALAADGVAQAEAQDRVLAARDGWQAFEDVARILADCEAYAEGAALPECAALAELMAGRCAPGFVQGWIADMVRAWRAAPLAQLPFRHRYTNGTGVIHLHRTGRVTLALLLIEPRAAMRPVTITFTDCERREVVLAGEGAGMAYRFDGRVAPIARPLALSPGTTLACDVRHSRAVIALDTPLVVLRVSRDPVDPQTTREVEIASGRIVHRASASPAEGRAELAAALLGAMGRVDAAPVLARYARGACGKAGEGARWQALRNALALETATGFAALREIAGREDDPLACQAGALQRQLCTTYPQLANMVETHAS